MQARANPTLLGLTLLLLAAGCQDSPTPAEIPPDGPAYARGGNGKAGTPPSTSDPVLTLGWALFDSEELSLERNQSCKTCHHPEMGFAGFKPGTGSFEVRGSVVEGSVAGQFGDRKPPSAAFATLAPLFSESGGNAVGGNFWDGRATGQVLGNPAMDQALGPFLNPKEQALPDEACVVYRIRQDADLHARYTAAYYALDGLDFGNASSICEEFHPTPGEHVATTQRAAIHAAYLNVGRAIAAHEASFNTFDSRFDAGQTSPSERNGAKIFSSKGKCQQCHDDKGSTPLFVDFQFHNLGVPKNPANPVYPVGTADFDPGLGGFTGNPAHLGKFRTPTVRNVAVGEADRTYMHNGSLPTLWHVVQFYNTRDILPVCAPPVAGGDPMLWGPKTASRPNQAGCWPAPEYPGNLDTRNMGNLGLTDAEVRDIVAFMRALNAGGGA